MTRDEKKIWYSTNDTESLNLAIEFHAMQRDLAQRKKPNEIDRTFGDNGGVALGVKQQTCKFTDKIPTRTELREICSFDPKATNLQKDLN